MYEKLFSEITIKGLTLKNRLTMAPLHLGYAGEGGTVSSLMLEHYELMAASGVAMIVVENATVDHPLGSISNRNLRADTEDNLNGLKKLAATIKNKGPVACLQLNHAGRFANAVKSPVAPSPIEIFGRVPRELDKKEITYIVDKFAIAAGFAKSAGFDMVELHGGTGYLLAQFLSPRTNTRADEYGGCRENRQRFAIEVIQSVKDAVGDIPVGYRFRADAWPPDGSQFEESRRFARTLEKAGIDYISVIGGTYEPFPLPKTMGNTTKTADMLDFAAGIRADINIPVIAAGRFATGAYADQVLSDGKADMIGLARVLWADPLWPKKVQDNRENEIIHCKSHCGACMQMVMKGSPAYCMAWPLKKRNAWKAKFI